MSDYAFVLEADGAPRLGVEPLRVEGTVEGVRRADGAWRLLQKILNKVPPDEGDRSED